MNKANHQSGLYPRTLSLLSSPSSTALSGAIRIIKSSSSESWCSLHPSAPSSSPDGIEICCRFRAFMLSRIFFLYSSLLLAEIFSSSRFGPESQSGFRAPTLRASSICFLQVSSTYTWISSAYALRPLDSYTRLPASSSHLSWSPGCLSYIHFILLVSLTTLKGRLA